MDLRGMKLGSASLTVERRLEDFLQMRVCDLPTELLRGLLGEQSYSLDKAWCISGEHKSGVSSNCLMISFL